MTKANFGIFSDSLYVHAGKQKLVNEKNILGFLILFSIFMSGLGASVIIAGKVITFLGLAAPASVFVWALTFPLSDIVTEVYGFKYARRMIVGSFFGFIAIYFFLWLAVIMPAAPFWDKQEEFEMFFKAGGRVVFGAVIAFCFVQVLDVYLFSYIKNKTKGKHLWLRNNFSTFISQTLGNTIFLLIAFGGVFEWGYWWTLYVGNLTLRYCLAFSDTIIVYFGVFVLYRFYPELKDSYD